MYVVPLSGMIVRKNIFISGSGSIYAMGYLDAHYKPNMSKEECLELVKIGKLRKSFDLILNYWTSHTYEFASNIALLAFPSYQVSDATMKKVEGWLEDHSLLGASRKFKMAIATDGYVANFFERVYSLV